MFLFSLSDWVVHFLLYFKMRQPFASEDHFFSCLVSVIPVSDEHFTWHVWQASTPLEMDWCINGGQHIKRLVYSIFFGFNISKPKTKLIEFVFSLVKTEPSLLQFKTNLIRLVWTSFVWFKQPLWFTYLEFNMFFKSWKSKFNKVSLTPIFFIICL